ncbi:MULTISPECIES: hypothetical protein [Pandoraea]|uniref:hypothetical protein n=1 Tax=Pandoraea TaxID=93217 RepID=UPI001F5CDBD0|nr:MULTISPECIES: hypothetical protein [Pandoraea]
MIKSGRFLVFVVALTPLAGHAQINQLSGLVQSARDAASIVGGLTSPHPIPSAPSDLSPLPRAERAASDAARQRGAERDAQNDFEAAKRAASACPVLVDERVSIAERFIRCRNGGLSQAQQMAFVGAMPTSAQGYMAAMVQDIYEDNVTDPGRGKQITDYYDGCYRRGTPCVRRRW